MNADKVKSGSTAGQKRYLNYDAKLKDKHPIIDACICVYLRSSAAKKSLRSHLTNANVNGNQNTCSQQKAPPDGEFQAKVLGNAR
jgi:hypothetical protein